MINMFPPPAALLKVTLPNPVPPFNTAARYATTGSQEIATLAELYDTLPQHLHHLVPMNRFSHVVMHISHFHALSYLILLSTVLKGALCWPCLRAEQAEECSWSNF
jgi:hypothetical protein